MSAKAPSTITIDGVEFVRKDSIAKPIIEGDTKIVVLHRGWVFQGNVTEKDGVTTIHNAKNIRRWGTTKGLGELQHGPKKDTVLDDNGTVITKTEAVIFSMPVDGKW